MYLVHFHYFSGIVIRVLICSVHSGLEIVCPPTTRCTNTQCSWHRECRPLIYDESTASPGYLYTQHRGCLPIWVITLLCPGTSFHTSALSALRIHTGLESTSHSGPGCKRRYKPDHFTATDQSKPPHTPVGATRQSSLPRLRYYYTPTPRILRATQDSYFMAEYIEEVAERLSRRYVGYRGLVLPATLRSRLI